MIDKRAQLRVGIFAVASAALVAGVLIVFGGVRLWSHRDHYIIEVADSVMGLEDGAQVYLDGIEVGRVDGLRIAPDDLGRVRVAIAVAAGTPVHADTRAYLGLPGLTGLKVIDLKGGSLAAPVIPPGGTILAGVGTLDKLEQQAERLADQTGQLMTRANAILDDAQHVTSALRAAVDPDALREITANLVAASHGVDAMIDDNRAALRQSLGALQVASATASDLMTKGVTGLVGNANDLVGELRGIVHGNESAVQSAMADLRQASRSFKELAREVREKPSRLLFSAAQADRKLP